MSRHGRLLKLARFLDWFDTAAAGARRAAFLEMQTDETAKDEAMSVLTIDEIRELRNQVKGEPQPLASSPAAAAAITIAANVVDVLLAEIDRLTGATSRIEATDWVRVRSLHDANGVEITDPDMVWIDVATGKGERAVRGPDGRPLVEGDKAVREACEYPAPLLVEWHAHWQTSLTSETPNAG